MRLLMTMKVLTEMTRWGDWASKVREAWEESQRRYPDGINPYYLEYQRKFCCCVCKREIRQGCFFQASTGLRWCVTCYNSRLT